MASLYCFNPDCEMAVADGNPYYTPPAPVERMAEELAYLPAWLGESEDVVLLPERPDSDFLQRNRKLFGSLPQPLLWEEYAPDPAFRPVPWGWSPRMDRLLQTACWQEKYRELMSRITARSCLERIGRALPFIDEELVPDVCHTVQAVRQAVSAGRVVLKSPWSSSGRGLLRLGPGRMTEKGVEWVRGVLHRQGYVMVEKQLEKVCDFAMEFTSEGGRCRFLVWSLFATGNRGEYRGNFLGGQHQIEAHLLTCADREELYKVRQSITDVLNVCVAPWYDGILGVDMMIYRDPEGAYRIQPCVEINLRHTMGYLAHRFSSRFVAEGSSGWFTLAFFPGAGEALQHHLQNKQDFPVQVNPDGRMVSGYHALTPVGGKNGFIASVRLGIEADAVGKSVHDFEDQLFQ